MVGSGSLCDLRGGSRGYFCGSKGKTSGGGIVTVACFDGEQRR